jgi:hypothetical protein
MASSLERSLDSFGVSGILDNNAEVLYHQIFSTRHIGRICDLMVARLKGNGVDEFKLRGFLGLALSVAYQHQNRVGQEMAQPLSIECGIDEEKIALSVSFQLSLNVFLNTEDLPSRVEKQTPTDSFEGYLIDFNKNSDRLLLRFSSENRKVEITSVLGMKGRMEDEFFKNKARLRVISFEEGQVREAPAPKRYIELGDIDYPTLLGMDVKQSAQVPSPSGEILMPGNGTEDHTETRLRSSGSSNELEPEKRFSSDQKLESSDEVIRVSGQAEEPINDEIVIVTSSKKPVEEQARTFLGGIFGGLSSALKKMAQPLRGSFLASEGQEDVPPSESAISTEESAQAQPQADSTEEKPPSADLNPSTESSEPNLVVEQLNTSGMEAALQNAQRELLELREGLKDQKAQKLADGLIGNLVKERSKLAQLSKEANLSLRQKEIEFRDKLTALREELKGRDLLISKKDSAIELSKNQIAQMNKVIEKLKVASQESSSLVQFRHKYQVSQKVLQSSKDENAALTKKVEELRTQLSSAQMARAQASPSSNMAALQTKYERAFRQAEDFKKANRQLIEQLNESKKGTSSSGKGLPEDLKGRLDAAMKLATVNKKEADTLRSRVSTLLQEEAKMKAMITQLQAQLKSGNNKPNGTSGNTPAAA